MGAFSMTSPRPISLVVAAALCIGLSNGGPWSRQQAIAQTQDREGAVDTAPAVSGTTPALPWPDAAPAPEGLPEEFARKVMRPVVLVLPGMDAVEYTPNLRYAEVDDPSLLLDVYRPPGASPAERLPAVLFIHGGTDTRTRPKDWGVFQSWGRLAAVSGLVGVTFTHRLGFPETRVREGAADVVAALQYVSAHAARFGIDPERVCLFAVSAGGPMLAPYMAEAPPAIHCLVGYYPFMDIRQTEHHERSETEETRDTYSNILRVRDPGRKTPLLLVRAGRDEIPTLLDSIDRFTAAALAADYPLTLVNHPEAPHGFDNEVDDARSREIVLETLSFLKHHLLGPDQPGPSSAPAPPMEGAEIAVVHEAIAAFNAHDADAFAALCADDVKWFGIAGDSQSVDGEGRESIRSWLTDYFESLPDVGSEISDLTHGGSHVAFREHVTWTAADGTPRGQSALGVYEIRDGKIRRAWYFPSDNDTP